MRYPEGFTQIELLVVVLIIGILSAIVAPQYKKAVMKRHLSNTLPLGNAIRVAGEAYKLREGQFPSEFPELDLLAPVGWTMMGASIQLQTGRGYSLISEGIWTSEGCKLDTLCSPNLIFFYQSSPSALAGKILCTGDTEEELSICPAGTIKKASYTEGEPSAEDM